MYPAAYTSLPLNYSKCSEERGGDGQKVDRTEYVLLLGNVLGEGKYIESAVNFPAEEGNVARDRKVQKLH